MMIDTHAHLYLEDFDADRSELMQRSEEAGVKKVYLPNIDSSTTAALLKMASDFPDKAVPMMGLHPCYVKENVKEELAAVQAWLQKRSFAAIGEIGLDYYWDTTFKAQQQDAFSQQIDWALAYDLPIVIHARNSLQDCIELVRSKQTGRLKGIFHCFSGSLEQAEQIAGLGFLMGIGGVLTFRKSTLPEVIRSVGLQHLVLETDAPYLTPAPFRGKRNESSYIPLIAEKLAEIKGVPLAEVAAMTTKNAQDLFRL